MNEHVVWRKSSRSGTQDSCVEAAVVGERVLVRDSKDPDGPRLSITYPEWRAFLAAVGDGEFNL